MKIKIRKEKKYSGQSGSDFMKMKEKSAQLKKDEKDIAYENKMEKLKQTSAY